MLWAGRTETRARAASIAAFALAFAANLGFCVLSWVEHEKSRRPSGLLNAYLLLSLVFDGAVLRTLWQTWFHDATRGIATAAFGVKGLVLLLEAREKGRYMGHDHEQRKSPEETAGLYNQSVFWWLNRIIRRGFRILLTPEDLYPVDESMASENLSEQFKVTWEECQYNSSSCLTLTDSYSVP